MSDGRIRPDLLQESVRRLDADVLALQEVDRLQPRSALADQAAEAARAMGATGYRYVDLVHGTPGEAGWVTGRAGRPDDEEQHDGPSYGIALLSRRPVRAWHVLHLEPPRGRFPLLMPTRPPRVSWLPDEPRAVVAAVLGDPEMTVACTHLSFVPGVNALQVRRARAWLASLPGPRVLLGDLNLPGRLPSRITGWTGLATRRTFPASAPRIQLDHILVSPDADVSWSRSQDQQLPVSDHRALVTELCLRRSADEGALDE